MQSSTRFRTLVTWGRRLAVDVLLSAAAFFAVTILPLLQFVERTNFQARAGLASHLAIYAAVAAVALALRKTYRMIWRYVSFGDFVNIIGVTTFTVVAFFAVELVFFNPHVPIPGTLFAWTLFLLWTANIGFLATPRFCARIVADIFRRNERGGLHHNFDQIPVLVTGDPVRIESFIRECMHNSASRYRVVGVLTNNTRFHGSYLFGVQVLDSVANLKQVLNQLSEQGIRPQTLVLAEDSPNRAEISHLLDLTAATNVKLGRLPPAGLTTDANTSVLPVNLSDLLRRPEIHIDMAAVARMIEGKCAMVTGGGGSIGSELSRQIAGFKPSKLVVLDFSEFNLYSIDKELEEKFPEIKREAALVDVRDPALVAAWIGKVRPDVVFHAAALKHVPLLEDHPVEGIKTNVFGTINLAEACLANGVSAFVTISTDKAVNPTNVMGATKRLAEAYCQGLDQAPEGNDATRFVTVRFGNVLGSAGSVVPLFQHQIESGGPVTVTHPDIKRYFMTIPEAVTLVLQAGAHGLSMAEERGSIYLLDMGEPVKIVDLARQMIQLAGGRPDVDIKIKIVGLRPGEKLYEETIHDQESILPTRSKAILKVAPRATDLRIIRQQVQELKQACTNRDRDRALRLLRISVPCYQPAGEENALVS